MPADAAGVLPASSRPQSGTPFAHRNAPGRQLLAPVRELVELLWKSVADSPGAVLVAPPGEAVWPAPRQPDDYAAPEGLGREQIVAALAAVGGVREQAWRLLGLRSRYQLKRLLKKHDIP